MEEYMDYFYTMKKAEWFFRRVYKKIGGRGYQRHKYAGHPILSQVKANDMLSQRLISNEPFCVLRFGYAECRLIESQLTKNIKKRRDYYEKDGKATRTFHTFGEFERYVEMVLHSCADADIMAYWSDLSMEDYIIQTYAPQSIPMDAIYLEPIGSKTPWTYSLKGKKVLIINPFVEEIKKQYERIHLVFPKDNPWPDMELRTIKSIWFPGSDFKTWFDGLDFLYHSAMDVDFDVALLSCGPFGFDLAAKFKKAGKQAIHIGGCLQMLFGIRGKRWDDNENYQKYVNEYWIRPSKTERPQGEQSLKDLDEACYW